MQVRDKIFLLFWLLICFFFGVESWRLDLGTFYAPGSGLFPFIASCITAVLAIALFFAQRLKDRTRDVEPFFRRDRVGKVICVCILLLAYPFMLTRFGFFLTNVFFVALCIKVIGTQKWSMICAISAGVASFSHILFVVWLGIQIPKGTYVSYFF